MSYLQPLRLHFAGRFQANVSTVNNDPGHFENAAFEPSFQKMQGPHMDPPNGWFNPEGDGSWRLRGCRVTSAWSAASITGPLAEDPVLGLLVSDAGDATSAKLVDLDPEQQLVSTIYGLQVRLVDPYGQPVLRSVFEPAAFIDIWDRAIASGHGDVTAGAMYQSVLSELQWGDVSSSPFLTELREAAADGVLSIKFNIDGINLDFHSPDFMSGRIVGTIGPATRSEPRHFVVGRQFMATAAPTSQFFTPNGAINFCVASVDRKAGAVLVDLGNALPTSTPGGPLVDVGDLVVRVTTPDPQVLATIRSSDYTADRWYETTAGIVVAPLSEALLDAVADHPLLIESTRQRPGASVYISEDQSGVFARADGQVARMSPGDTVEVHVHASQWGEPLAGATLTLASDDSQLQPSNALPGGTVPPVSTPSDALKYPESVITDANGLAVVAITGTDPGTPRWFANGSHYGIDGQVYGIRPSIAALADGSHPVTTENPWNFVSVLLWSAFRPGNAVTWNDLEPIFTQYGNLYPVMRRFVDMTSYDSVVAYAWELKLAFGLDERDPNCMPVTRDLSPAKRAAIIAWLSQDPPPRGAPPPPPAARMASAVGTGGGGTVVPPELAARGGKAAAAARRRARTGGRVES